MPKVSIIVPVYNVEEYLEQCLNSLINQSLQDIEVIIVDDGSKDNSANICDRYSQKDKRIKVIHKQNEGLGKAYNTGIKIAQGEYIGFVESDDFVELNMFEEMYKLAQRYQADIVKSDWYNYYANSKEKDFKANSYEDFVTDEIINISSNPEILIIQPTIWSAIYNRQFLKNNNITFLETPGASYQDTSFAFKTTSSAQRFILTDKAYVHYRRDNENSSINSKDKVFDICPEYEEIENFLNSNPLIDNSVKSYRWIIYYFGYLWNLKRVATIYKKQFADVFSKLFLDAYQNGRLDDSFFYYISKKEIKLLINNPNCFVKKYGFNEHERRRKRKLLSIVLKIKQFKVTILGKKLIDIH